MFETSSLEADVKKALKAYLKEKGAWSFMPVPMGRGRRTVDFLVCYWGKFIAIETKRPSKPSPTKLQRYELYSVRQAGGYAIVENSKGLEATRAVFSSIENSTIRDRRTIEDYGYDDGEQTY